MKKKHKMVVNQETGESVETETNDAADTSEAPATKNIVINAGSLLQTVAITEKDSVAALVGKLPSHYRHLSRSGNPDDSLKPHDLLYDSVEDGDTLFAF